MLDQPGSDCWAQLWCPDGTARRWRRAVDHPHGAERRQPSATAVHGVVRDTRRTAGRGAPPQPGQLGIRAYRPAVRPRDAGRAVRRVRLVRPAWVFARYEARIVAAELGVPDGTRRLCIRPAIFPGREAAVGAVEVDRAIGTCADGGHRVAGGHRARRHPRGRLRTG